MKRILTSALLFTAISSAGQTGTEEVHLPVIRYNPAPVCLLIRSSIPVRYLSVQEAFIVSLKDGDTEIAPKCIGIKEILSIFAEVF